MCNKIRIPRKALKSFIGTDKEAESRLLEVTKILERLVQDLDDMEFPRRNPGRATNAVEAAFYRIIRIDGGVGVESTCGGWNAGWPDHEMIYINTGDAYMATLIFLNNKGRKPRIIISSWADVIENSPRSWYE